MGDLLEFATDRFELFSVEPDLVLAYEEGGKKKFRGIASSTTKDLHGDVITLEALQDMETQVVGLTMFLNHSYNVPDDVGGTITKAIVRQKGVDQNGDPNYQLEIEGEVEEENPQALKTWSFVKKGRRLGLSIGAMIPTGGATRNKDGTLIINRLQLLEVSFVGIPANPKSWIEYAASAIRQTIAKAKTHELGTPTLTLSEGRYKIEGSLDGLDINLGADTSNSAVPLNRDGEPLTEPEIDWTFAWDRDNKVAVSRSVTTPMDGGMVELSVDPMGSWDIADEDDRLAAIAMVGEDVINKATVWVETRDGDKIQIGEPEVVDSVSASVEPDLTDKKNKTPCPECGKTDCDSDGDLHGAAPDPDVADAKIRIIEVDTDEASSDGDSQGASSSEPVDALAAPEADVTADGEPLILDGATEDALIKLSFDQLRMVALRATADLVAAKEELRGEKAARIEAEQQRDAVAEAAGALVARTAAVIEKVANAPLVRKAAIRDVQNQFSASVESYYGTEFARALAGKK